MADFTTVLSGTVQVDNSDITEEIKSEFIIQYNQANVMDQFVEYERQIDAKSISFPRFTLTATAETPLNEREDVTSIAMADTEVILTPAEHGMAITPTRLVNLQTGGRALRAAVALAAINMAETRNKLGTAALEASGNTVSAGGNMSPSVLNQIYNKLARTNVPAHPLTGTYVAFMHDDVIHDLREGSSAGSWEDINKYNNEIPVLKNEVGMFKGFRIIRNNHAAIDVSGSPAENIYKSSFLGYNGLGMAESQMPAVTLTGPFDKLGRFINIGWYGVCQYKIVESTAVYTATSLSSVAVD